MSIRLRAALAAASCVAFGHVLAQEAVPPIPPTAASAPALAQDTTVASTAADAAAMTHAPDADGPAIDACCVIPAGSPVLLEILDPLSSANAMRGDGFRFRLAEPVRLGDAIAIPAGTEGHGEIIHAQRAGSGGKAGELLLAARYLEHAGTRIALRGMKLGGSGNRHVNAAVAVALATGPFGMLVRGGDLEVPAGMIAQAKLATSFAAGPVPPSIPTLPTPGDATGDVPHATDIPATTTTRQE